MHVPLARPPSVHNISRVTSVAEAEALPGVMFLMRPGKTLTSPPSMLPSPIWKSPWRTCLGILLSTPGTTSCPGWRTTVVYHSASHITQRATG